MADWAGAVVDTEAAVAVEAAACLLTSLLADYMHQDLFGMLVAAAVVGISQLAASVDEAAAEEKRVVGEQSSQVEEVGMHWVAVEEKLEEALASVASSALAEQVEEGQIVGVLVLAPSIPTI